MKLQILALVILFVTTGFTIPFKNIYKNELKVKSTYDFAKWGFAYNEGYNQYYGRPVFTNVFDFNRIPGAYQCRTAGECVTLMQKFVQHYYDTHFPNGDFGGVDIRAIILSPNSTSPDCWGSLQQDYFFTNRVDCEKIKQNLLTTDQRNPNRKIMYVDLFQ